MKIYDLSQKRRVKHIIYTTSILLVSILFSTSYAFAQTTQRITLQHANVTLKTAFQEIERQTGLSVDYEEPLIDLNKKVEDPVNNMPLNQALETILKNTGYSYTIQGTHIIIARRKPSGGNTQKEISGTVTDATGEPIIGANIVEKGTNNGTVSDLDGNFTLQVGNQARLTITYIGFSPLEVAVGNQRVLNIKLSEDAKALEEVVVVGYGTQKKGNLTGSIATVQAKDLTIAPIASTTNALAGRLPGLISVQSNGQPGNDAADLSIRGFGNALVIVDGIESSFNNIDANQIESISILKDGAASIYGARAGNGVILVTTKRGNIGKPTISFNASGTLQGITIMPKLVSAGQYAEMLSESWLQSGQPADQVPYTPEQIQKYYEGNDPLYPNTDWHKELIRNWAPQQQYNVSIRGGNDAIKYYGFFGYLDQESMWKNNGGNYKKYNFQSNIDAKVLDNLSLQLTLSSVIEDGKFPARDQSPGGLALWQDFWYMLPIYPASLPDKSKIPFGGNGGTGGVHITSNSELSGYSNYEKQNLNGTFTLNYESKFVEGLSFKAFGNYVQYYNSSKTFIKPVDYYLYDPVGDIYTLAGSYGSNAQMNISQWKGRTLTGQFSVSYERTINEDHQINALALYEAIDYKSDTIQAGRVNFLTPAIDQLYAGSTSGMSNYGSAWEMGRLSYVGRLNYSYKNKYLIETILRADASAKFPPGQRWGYFPSVSAGWRMSEEKFMQGLNIVDNLKLRASYGASGNDGVGNFQYLSGYRYDYTYYFGDGPEQSLSSTGLANPYLTWEKIKIYNGGLDFSLWSRKLYGEIDAFYRTRKGIPATRLTTLPSSFGADLPPENINSLNDRGFELMLGTSHRINDFSFDISGNVSWSRSKWDHFEEPDYDDPDQARLYKRSGRWTDFRVGYLTDGLFSSQEEINALMFDQDLQGNKTLRPGDVRYVDVNGDGILDWRDQVEIGKGEIPHWMVGINMYLTYKDFDFSALFQGAFGYNKHLVFSNSMTNTYFEERWTEENNNRYALVPRLGGSSLNWLDSDYYYRKAGYLRLKTASLGYNLPKHLLQAIYVQQLRVYLAGTNLFTFDKLKKYKIDPEAPSGVGSQFYPQQRTITLGVNLSF